jgi:PBP1b-binding outer membrane lipoprotein LpoB
MNKLILIIILGVLLSGCSSDKDMREKFGDNKPHMVYDVKTGDTYIVTHSFGDNYNVVPLDY